MSSFHLLTQHTSDRHCFVSVPRTVATQLFSHARDQRGHMVLKVTWREDSGTERTVYVGWKGDINDSGASSGLTPSASHLSLSALYAKCLSLPTGIRVRVEAVLTQRMHDGSLSTGDRVEVEPVSVDDWEILELNASYLELHLLEQISVLTPNIHVPFFVHSQLIHIRLVSQHARGFAKLGLSSEIVVAPKTRAMEKKAGRTIAFPSSSPPPAPASVPPKHRVRIQRWIDASNCVRDGTHAYVSEQTAAKLKCSDGDSVLITVPPSPNPGGNSHADENGANDLSKHASSTNAPTVPTSIVCTLHTSTHVTDRHIMLPFLTLHYLSLRPTTFLHVQRVYDGNAMRGDKLIHMLRLREVVFHPLDLNSHPSILPTPLSSPSILTSFNRYLLASLPHAFPIVHGQLVSFEVSEETGDRSLRSFIVGVNKELDGEPTPPSNDEKSRVADEQKRKSDVEIEDEDEEGIDVPLPTRPPPVAPKSAAPGVKVSLATTYYLLSNPQPPLPSASSRSQLSVPLPTPVIVPAITLPFPSDPLALAVPLTSLGGIDSAITAATTHLTTTLSPMLARERASLHAPAAGHAVLCGGAGGGKTALAMALARHYRHMAGVHGHVEWIACHEWTNVKLVTLRTRLRDILSTALARAPSLIVFDDIDKLCPAPSDQHVASNAQVGRIVETIQDVVCDMLACAPYATVALLATAASPISFHPSLALPDLFPTSIEIPPPDATAREHILRALLVTNGVDGAKVDVSKIAGCTEGYMPVDMQQLVARAMAVGSTRIVAQHAHRERHALQHAHEHDHTQELMQDSPFDHTPSSNLALTTPDFDTALRNFVPSSLTDLPLTTTRVQWNDIGAMHSVKQLLKDTLQLPTRFARIFANCPLKLRSGVLLYGPPGCGKTMIASAVAAECGLHCITIKGPELLNKYIGSSEQSVRDTFARARAAAPCVLLFDEFEAIVPRRGGDSTGVTDRVVNQFLCELDGVEARAAGVYVLACSSRPDLIDPALLRPGRLDKTCYCGMPDENERFDICNTVSRTFTLADDVNLRVIAQGTEHWNGADLASIFTTAQLTLVSNAIEADRVSREEDEKKGGDKIGKRAPTALPPLTQVDLLAALESSHPSISPSDRAMYDRIYSRFIAAREKGSGAGFDPHAPQKTALA